MKSPQHIRKALADLHLDDLLDAVVRRYHLLEGDVLGAARTVPAPAARHHLWYAMRARTKWSYTRIAAVFGVDHTTVMHGVQQHEWRRQEASIASARREKAEAA